MKKYVFSCVLYLVLGVLIILTLDDNPDRFGQNVLTLLCSIICLGSTVIFYGRYCQIKRILEIYRSLNNDNSRVQYLLTLDKTDIEDLRDSMTKDEVEKEKQRLESYLCRLTADRGLFSGTTFLIQELKKVAIVLILLNKIKC